ncbi:MAG: FAD-binding protein, partial [Christensenellaceae bacterium]|nr:FAD-binding protein [Christensenellaceae bacterium]
MKIAKTIKSDVLVVGGGGAGVYAAIEALRSGASVVLASKGKVGNSGNTIMIGGSYAMDGHSAKHRYGFEKGDDTVTKEVLLEQIIKQSFFLSEQDVAEQFVEDSPACVYEMYEWTERAGQKQTFMSPGGWLISGHAMGVGLQQGLKENPGVQMVEDVMITELLTAEGRIAGAIGLDVYTGEVIRFDAKAVILATGGYQPFSCKSTNSDMTGDGVAIAYRAGAKLADMEFLLPCMTALEPAVTRGSLMPFIYECMSGIAMSSVDKNGDPIVVPEEMRKVAEGSELEKLISTYYWSQAVEKGNGLEDDGMYYDFTGMSDEEIRASFQRYIDIMATFYRKGYYHGESIEMYRDYIIEHGKRIKVGAVFEYTMGGIVIDKDMATNVPGLYAAGEAGSGVFGACRVADATTEMLVQGWKAGRTAAAYAKEAPAAIADEAQVQAILEELERPLTGDGQGMSGVDCIGAIHKAADLGFG